MNVYVETNFYLELALQQEQHEACEQILELADCGRITLLLPAYCMGEALFAVIGRQQEYKRMQDRLQGQLIQLQRNKSYASLTGALQDSMGLMARAHDDARNGYARCRARILQSAILIDLNRGILSQAAHQEQFLKPPDAMVMASVMAHLRHNAARACFLNKNSKDFTTPDVRGQLDTHDCQLLSSFEDGLAHIRAHLPGS